MTAPRPTLRRGLPRRPGAEPWPPASEAPAADAVPAVANAVSPVADAVSPAADVPPVADAANPVADAVPPVADAASPVADAVTPVAELVEASTSSPEGTLRRGLPRVAGGDPWPPVTPVPHARDRYVASIGSAPETEAPETEAPETEAPETEAPETEAPETAAAAAPEIAAAVAVVPSGPRMPLPFTPTVWPGTAATSRPSAQREAEPSPKSLAERLRRPTWTLAISGLLAGLALLILAAMAVFATRWLISLPLLQDFLATYPGEYELPEGSLPGFPAWLQWQHFFNMFLIVLIIRTGLQVRTEKRPAAFWTPKWSKNGRGKISLALWFHQSLDVLWLVNGILFVVLLVATGYWVRIVPTSWEVFPNAISAAIQYLSLDWPTEHGWVNYNSLQQLAYFTTVFVAAPLAAVTGARMSGFWPKNAKTLNRAYPIEWARAVHFPIMLYFVAFIIVHAALVFATGALRNLNHMYAGTDVVNWVGFWIFVGSIVLIIAGWIAARPLVLAPIAALSGKVSGR